MSLRELADYINSKINIKLSPEGLRKIFKERAPHKIINEPLEKREEYWMNLEK